MAAHQPGPKDWANGVPEPAKVDGNFAVVQTAVRAKAGLAATGGASPEPISVNIRMNNNGKTFAVHHIIALQRVLQGAAALV